MSPLDRSQLAEPLELYRPFLSYSELGSLIDGSPSGMYDALHSLLGLDDLTTALTTLQRRRLDLDKEVKRGKGALHSGTVHRRRSPNADFNCLSNGFDFDIVLANVENNFEIVATVFAI